MLKFLHLILHQMLFPLSRYLNSNNLFLLVSFKGIFSTKWSSIQELLTKHKILCAEFLEANYDKVFAHYQGLLNSENYVTRRQSLKLLGELLLDRHNFTVSFACCNR